MKKILAIIGGIILVLVFGILFVIPVSNDYAAMKTAKRAVDIPLPKQTEYIESAYLAGKLTGNGNGMQYFGAILVKSDLSVDELAAYYRNFNDDSQEYNVERAQKRSVSLTSNSSR